MKATTKLKVPHWKSEAIARQAARIAWQGKKRTNPKRKPRGSRSFIELASDRTSLSSPSTNENSGRSAKSFDLATPPKSSFVWGVPATPSGVPQLKHGLEIVQATGRDS